MRGFSLHYMNGEKAAFSFQAEMVDFGAIAVSCKQKNKRTCPFIFPSALIHIDVLSCKATVSFVCFSHK